MAQAPDQPGGPALGHRIVKPNAVEILADKGRNQLTLMACNPKYYATQRIVVEALLVGNPVAGKPADPRVEREPGRPGRPDQGRQLRAPAGRAVAAGRARRVVPDLAGLAPPQAAPGARRRGRGRRPRRAGSDPDGFGFDEPGAGADRAPRPASPGRRPPPRWPRPPRRRPARRWPRRPSAASWWLRWTPYLIGFPIFIVCLYASFEAFSKVLPGAF